MTVPFQQPGQPQAQAPALVVGMDGRTYMQTQQGMIPVVITPQQSAGDPSRQQQQQQPQPQHQQQQQQPAPQQQQGAGQTILRGPGIPQELQGRTLEDGIRVYNLMKEEYIKSRSGGQQQQQNGQPAQQNGQTQQQPANGQQPAPVNANEFYRDPWGNTVKIVEDTLKRTLQPMLEPIIQNQRGTQAQSVQQQFFAAHPEAQVYSGAILQQVAAMPPEQQGNPGAWEAVYRYVLGEVILQQQQRGIQPAAQPSQQGYAPPGTPWHQQPQAQQHRPADQYFAESSTPSPQNLGAPRVDVSNLSSWELTIARQSGQTPEQYAQAKADLAAGRMPSFGMAAGGNNGR